MTIRTQRDTLAVEMDRATQELKATRTKSFELQKQLEAQRQEWTATCQQLKQDNANIKLDYAQKVPSYHVSYHIMSCHVNRDVDVM